MEYESGKAIYDSNIINVYLDEKYPEVPLQASDPLRRAQDKLLVESFSAVSLIYLKYQKIGIVTKYGQIEQARFFLYVYTILHILFCIMLCKHAFKLCKY